MMKRLFTSLFAGALLIAGTNAEAKTPVISNMPDVTIGNMEDYAGPTAPKMFVFTNAFDFDNKVNYSGTVAVTNLKWSFAEEGTQQWYQINGIDPIAVGAVDMAAKEAAGVPKDPGAKNLRAAATSATFRDIVLSPVSGTPSESYSEHAAGKVVRFYVSDGTGVAKKDIMVKSVDGGTDSAVVPANSVQVLTAMGMHSDPGVSSTNTNVGWYATLNRLGSTSSAPPYASWNETAKAVEIKAGTLASQAAGYLLSEIQDNLNTRIKFSDIGATAAEAKAKVVRAKFWMYAAGQNSVGQPSDTIQIPSVRFKLQTGFSVANSLGLFIGNHNQFDATRRAQYINALKQVAPSTDSSKPSCYTVDFKPCNVDYIYNNSLQNDTVSFGFMTSVELYQDMPNLNGSLFLTQTEIGFYPAAAIDPSKGTLMKTFTGTDLRNPGYSAVYDTIKQNSDASFTDNATLYRATIYTGMNAGNASPYGSASFDGGRATVTYSAADGVAMDGRNFTPVLASDSTVCELYIDVPTVCKAASAITGADYATVARVDRDKMYLVRYTVDNPYVAAVNMPGIQFRSTVGYYWQQRYEINYASLGGASSARGLYNQSCMPGSTAKVYDVIMASPMDWNINANQTAVDAQPGPGAATGGFFRDITPGVSMIDSLGAVNEKGYMRLKRVEIYSFDKDSIPE